MRCRVALATLSLTLVATAAAQRFEPFVPIGVWYDARDRSSAVVLRDLQTIRALGFSHVEVPAPWASTEPERGGYRFEALDRLLTFAAQTDLKVLIDPQLDPPPAWLETPAVDPRAILAFVEKISSHAAQHPSFLGDPRLSAFTTFIDARPPASLSPAQVIWRLDAMRSAAGDRGWRLGRLTIGPRATGADLRLWGWTAIAHGARAITYFSWYPATPSAGTPGGGLVDGDGSVTPRARTAGEFAGIVSRNAALFAPLRPRPSRVAVVYNPLWDVMPIAAATAARDEMLQFYTQLFEQNIQTDVILPDAIAAGAAAAYVAVFAGSPAMLPSSIRDALDAYARAGGTVITEGRPDVETQQKLQPAVRVDGGGLVSARLLESPDALMLIAINHAESARRVTFRFAAEMPEAIWQNMESGASVSFVQGPDGLTYEHAFAARDALVLAIRKRPVE